MDNANETPVSIGNWMLTYLLVGIPVVGLILLFIWAFGSDTPASKANWSRASLIWGVIAIAIYAVMFAVFGAAIIAAVAAGA